MRTEAGILPFTTIERMPFAIHLEYRARHRGKEWAVSYRIPEEMLIGVIDRRDVLAHFDRKAHEGFSRIDATDH